MAGRQRQVGMRKRSEKWFQVRHWAFDATQADQVVVALIFNLPSVPEWTRFVDGKVDAFHIRIAVSADGDVGIISQPKQKKFKLTKNNFEARLPLVRHRNVGQVVPIISVQQRSELLAVTVNNLSCVRFDVLVYCIAHFLGHVRVFLRKSCVCEDKR